MKKTRTNAEKRKKIIQELIQTVMIHEAISAQTLQRVFQRKKSPEEEKINTLLQRFHNEFPMECTKGSSRLHQIYALRSLALRHF